MKNVIEVKNITKAYKLYSDSKSRLFEWLDPRDRPRHTLRWVLKDISFNVFEGQSVGIIGINGAGKSTLLKLITGTAFPTSGSISINGRIAALLELGIGFHPEFTGRQNVYLAGQLLGLKEEQISDLMPSIEAFAEIGEFIDQPLRIYSSGMQMRLAFSIATAVRPDILIVDEALSVGDTYFQHKSFERIRRFRELGTTLLIVSHDKQAIQSVCDRAILLSDGQIVKEGDPDTVFDYYNALLADKSASSVELSSAENGRIRTKSGSGQAEIISTSIQNELGSEINVVNVGEHINLKIMIRINDFIPRLVIGYLIKDRVGQAVFGTNSYHLDHEQRDLQKDSILETTFSFKANFGAGAYSITVALTGTENHLSSNFEWLEFATMFTVVNVGKPYFEGITFVDNTIKTRRYLP